jgi:hypothetical protein
MIVEQYPAGLSTVGIRPDVGYSPLKRPIAALPQMTQRAKGDRVQLQQIFEAKSRNRVKSVDKETLSN